MYVCVHISGFIHVFEESMLMTMYIVHVLHVHVYIAPTMLSELLYPLQSGNIPLHLAARGGHILCVEHLLSTPGIDVNIKNEVSWSTEY